MKYSFFIIGGDMRMFYLAKSIVNDNFEVKLLGFEKIGYDNLLNNNIKIAHSINDTNEGEILIGPAPLSIDGETIYAPYSDRIIKINELENRYIIAGKIPNYIKGKDILKDESYAILNSIPTAEGTIAKVIEESKKTIYNSNVLVLGYGRIGKILCSRLKSLGANVYCSARKKEDLTWIKALQCYPIHTDDIDNSLCKMKIIINTIPALILNKKRLLLVKPNTIIIDLASNTGGVDWKTAKKLNIKTLHYLGIPGKTAPESSAEYMKEYIYELLDLKV